MDYVLIKNGKVKNIIVADASFVARIRSNFDSIIEVDSLPVRPGIGWDYDGSTFSAPAPEIPEAPEERPEKVRLRSFDARNPSVPPAIQDALDDIIKLLLA